MELYCIITISVRVFGVFVSFEGCVIVGGFRSGPEFSSVKPIGWVLCGGLLRQVGRCGMVKISRTGHQHHNNFDRYVKY
jgi:hypothetical protein